METNTNGAICGGVISDSLFNTDPMAYMMCYTMPDDKFYEYKKLRESGKEKEATKLFEKYAYSAIG